MRRDDNEIYSFYPERGLSFLTLQWKLDHSDFNSCSPIFSTLQQKVFSAGFCSCIDSINNQPPLKLWWNKKASAARRPEKSQKNRDWEPLCLIRTGQQVRRWRKSSSSVSQSKKHTGRAHISNTEHSLMGCCASQCFSTMESSATIKADPRWRRRRRHQLFSIKLMTRTHENPARLLL